MSIRFRNTQGFSLIEIISVVTIISLISLIVLITNITNSAELSKEKDIAKAHLSYARSMALSNDVYNWGIDFSQLTSYTFFKKKDLIRTDVLLPGQSSVPYELPQGMKAAAIILTFNEKGVAVNNSGIPLSSDQTIQFSDVNGNTETITITKNTGFVK